MAGEADQILRAADEPVVDERKSDYGTESDSPAVSTSSNVAAANIADKTILDMSDYWKKSIITEVDHQAYHSAGWLTDGLESLVCEVDVPTVDGSTVVYFETHLVAGLGLPPSKFLVVVMNLLRCELVHFNPNAIAALSCFTMLCECWLGISPDTSLFGTSIPQSDMTRSSTLGSGCPCVAVAKRLASMLPSRAPGRVLRRGGS
jgi:hypothetical protein